MAAWHHRIASRLSTAREERHNGRRRDWREHPRRCGDRGRMLDEAARPCSPTAADACGSPCTPRRRMRRHSYRQIEEIVVVAPIARGAAKPRQSRRSIRGFTREERLLDGEPARILSSPHADAITPMPICRRRSGEVDVLRSRTRREGASPASATNPSDRSARSEPRRPFHHAPRRRKCRGGSKGRSSMSRTRSPRGAFRSACRDADSRATFLRRSAKITSARLCSACCTSRGRGQELQTIARMRVSVTIPGRFRI